MPEVSAGPEPHFALQAEMGQDRVERRRQRRQDQVHVAPGQLQRRKTGLAQQFEQAAAREELKVLRVLQLAHGEADHAERAIEPKGGIRRRQDQPAAGLEHAIHFGGENLRRRHVLDDFGAEGKIERCVRIIDAALEVGDLAFEAVAAIARNALFGDVDAAHFVALGGKRQRVRARAATDVENVEWRVVGNAVDGVDLAGPRDLGALRVFPVIEYLDALMHGVTLAGTDKDHRSAVLINCPAAPCNRGGAAYATIGQHGGA